MCQRMIGCINVGYTEIHVTPGLFAEVVVSQIRSAGGVSFGDTVIENQERLLAGRTRISEFQKLAF